MRVVDLALVLVHDSVGLVSEVRLMVPRLSENHDLRVLSAIAASLMHLLLIVPRAFADDDGARVASVRKVYCATVLVHSDNCAATEAGIKGSLSFELRLDLKKAGH